LLIAIAPIVRVLQIAAGRMPGSVLQLLTERPG
jgi:hypothetical protein